MEYTMTLTNFCTAIAQLSGLLFVVASLLAMGMSLTVPLIMQPLKSEVVWDARAANRKR